MKTIISKTIPLFCIVMLSVACLNKKSNESDKDLFEPSFKEQKDSLNFIEYFDTINNIYSNYKYNIAVSVPNNWKKDEGVSEHTIFRTFEKDSGYSFSVNVIETKYNVENKFWEEYEINKADFEYKYKKVIENQLNVPINIEYTKITFLKNFKSLKRKFNYTLKDEDYEVKMTSIIFQVPKENFTFTFSLTVPNIFYETKPEYFENILKNIYWLSNKEKIKKTIFNK
jgi:hypothetical protein